VEYRIQPARCIMPPKPERAGLTPRLIRIRVPGLFNLRERSRQPPSPSHGALVIGTRQLDQGFAKMGKHMPVSLTCRKCATKLQWPNDASDSTEVRCQKCGEHFGIYRDLRNAALDALTPRYTRQKKSKTVKIVSKGNPDHKLRITAAIGRPTQRRMGDYVVVPGSQGPRRDFRISVGLREGRDAEGRVFDVSEAVRTARAWMKRRVEAGCPALSGMFTRAEVTYVWHMFGHATTEQSGRIANPWPCSRAKLSTPISVICTMGPSRRC
jgi:hypothetical protein